MPAAANKLQKRMWLSRTESVFLEPFSIDDVAELYVRFVHRAFIPLLTDARSLNLSEKATGQASQSFAMHHCKELSRWDQPPRRDASLAAGETPTLLERGVRSSRPRALGRPRPRAVRAEVEVSTFLLA